MPCLYARMPNGTERDFGARNAAIATNLPPVEADIFVGSLVVTAAVQEVGAGNVGEFRLHYEIREQLQPAN